MCRIWIHVALLVVLACGCTITSGSYTQLNPSPRALYVRAPQQVELFASSAPQRAHVDVGLITIEEGDVGKGRPDELLAMLREMAGQYGCDAVVVAPPAWQSHSRRSYKVYSGTCVVYREPALTPLNSAAAPQAR